MPGAQRFRSQALNSEIQLVHCEEELKANRGKGVFTELSLLQRLASPRANPPPPNRSGEQFAATAVPYSPMVASNDSTMP